MFRGGGRRADRCRGCAGDGPGLVVASISSAGPSPGPGGSMRSAMDQERSHSARKRRRATRANRIFAADTWAAMGCICIKMFQLGVATFSPTLLFQRAPNGGSRAGSEHRPTTLRDSANRVGPRQSRLGRTMRAGTARLVPGLRGRLPGRQAERFRMGPEVVLGQDLVRLPGRYATVRRQIWQRVT